MLVLILSLLSGGCSNRQVAWHPAVPHSSSPPPSAAPQLNRYPLAELALRPCLALDPHDLAALGITAPGEEGSSKNGPSCTWQIGGQNVDLDMDVALSFAQTMTKGGRITQVPVGQHNAVQAEFQRICFIFVAVDELDHLIGATTIPDPGAPQEGACPAGASVVAAALTHIN